MPIGTKKFETNQTVPERRKWRVMRRTERNWEGVRPDKNSEFIKFNRNGFFDTDDQGVAHAIHDSVGQGGTGELLVIATEKHMDTTHQRTFTVGIRFDEDGKIVR